MVQLVGSLGTCSLMDPTVAQAIKCIQGVNIFLDPLPLTDKEFIIIPVNNCKETKNEMTAKDQDDRGSHWSTLIFYKTKGHFYYYDSVHNTNLPDAILID